MAQEVGGSNPLTHPFQALMKQGSRDKEAVVYLTTAFFMDILKDLFVIKSARIIDLEAYLFYFVNR